MYFCIVGYFYHEPLPGYKNNNFIGYKRQTLDVFIVHTRYFSYSEALMTPQIPILTSCLTANILSSPNIFVNSASR